MFYLLLMPVRRFKSPGSKVKSIFSKCKKRKMNFDRNKAVKLEGFSKTDLKY